MIRQARLLILCLLFAACKNVGSGSAVIDREQMSKVLWDMIQVDELATMKSVKDTTMNVKMERMQLYDQVFRLHNISQKQFSISFHYYSDHPDIMKQLFDSLDARGARERKTGYLSKDSIAK